MKMMCPHCGLGGTAEARLYGKKVRCPHCRLIFRVNDEVIVDLANDWDRVIEQSLMGEDHGCEVPEDRPERIQQE